MAFFSASRGELHCKIVYCGPGWGGKTTNLQHVHSCLPAGRRGALISLQTGDERTLYFDLLPLDLGRIGGWRVRFHLYTVPGQPRYRTSRRIVLQGADGIVFVADSDPARMEANRESLLELRAALAAEGRSRASLPLVFQYNKRDLPGAVPVTRLAALLEAGAHPAGEAVALRGEGVLATLRRAIAAVLQDLSAAAPQEQHT